MTHHFKEQTKRDFMVAKLFTHFPIFLYQSKLYLIDTYLFLKCCIKNKLDVKLSELGDLIIVSMYHITLFLQKKSFYF